MADKQRKFHRCQKCGILVDMVYQKGYCKDCLSAYFQALRPMLNNAHAYFTASSKE